MPDDVVRTGTENAGTTAVATGADTTKTPAGTGGDTSVQVMGKEGSALASLQKVAAAASSAATSQDIKTDPKTGKLVEAGAGTTVQPGQPGANAGAQGEDKEWLGIPEQRRNTILQNAREDERKKLLSELGVKDVAEIAWAKGLDGEVFNGAVGLSTRINENPVGFAVQLIGELLEFPQAAAVLRQHLGPVLGVTTGGGQPGAGTGHQYTRDGKFVVPEGKFTDEGGKTRFYTGDQVAEILTNFETHLDEKYGGRLALIEDMQSSLEEREVVGQVIQESRDEGVALMTEMRALQHWPLERGPGNEGEKKIAKYLSEIPKDVRMRLGAYGSVMRAFNTYKEKDVYPTLGQKTEAKVREDNLRKAAASTGNVTPQGGGQTAQVKKPTNVKELAKHMEQMASAQGSPTV